MAKHPIRKKSVQPTPEAVIKHVKSTREVDTIMVGPALVYDDRVCIMIVSGPPGNIDCVDMGEYAGDIDPMFLTVVQTALMIKRADQTTLSEARMFRDDLIKEARRAFRSVSAFDCERQLVRSFASTFPSEKSAFLAREVCR